MQVPLSSQAAPKLHHTDHFDISGDLEHARERNWDQTKNPLCDHVEVPHPYRHGVCVM